MPRHQIAAGYFSPDIREFDGVTFAEAWRTRDSVIVEGLPEDVPLHYLGRDNLIRNKEAAGRPKDLAGLAFLRPMKPPSP